MTRVAISPRSFRQVPGRHQELLARSGLEFRYPIVDRHLSEEEMVALVTGCDALVVGIDPVTAQVLDAGPLRVVAKYGSGLDNIDLEAARARGVAVAAAPGANAQGVAELTLALLFALARHIVPHHLSAREGRWERRIGIELSGKRLGIVGLGQVGRRVAAIAQGVGMEVVAHDLVPKDAQVPLVGLEELLAASDAVALHVPLTDATRGMVDRGFLQEMTPGALLVNTARGGLLDFDAVTEALHTGRLAGAAMDDFEECPGPDSSLWVHPGFIASPHAGASTVEAVERTGVAALEAILREVAGWTG